MWDIKKISDVKLKNPILIEGLPGMGNVGKIAVDFIVESLNAKKIYEIYSYKFPHSVFVNEDNLIELPTISLYYKKINGKDFLFMSGDIQPIDEISCHEFCDMMLDIIQKSKGKDVITLGGIGLQTIPKQPKLYCTGTNKKAIENYSADGICNNIYGSVGPIMGVTGVLLGLAKKRKMDGVGLLTETFGHPNYLGFKGARKLVEVLANKFDFKIDLSKLDKEANEIEKDMNIKKITKINKEVIDTSYIG